jgi:hypothetical protein
VNVPGNLPPELPFPAPENYITAPPELSAPGRFAEMTDSALQGMKKLCALALAAAALTSRGAHAAPLEELPAQKGRAAAGSPAGTKPSEERPTNGYWSVGDPRWFISSKSDLGGIYGKPYLSAGYGLPHWIWAGVDLNAISTLEFGQVYGGVRASSPVLDIAFGARDTYSYGKPFLEPRKRFIATDLSGPGANARYWAWEGEVVGIVPLPYSAILLDYSAVRTLDVPRGKEVYDEPYRAVVRNPFFQVFRVAAVARVLREGALKFGVLTELVSLTGRGQNVFRMGPAFALQFTDHLEALGTLSIAVSSPDALGLALGAYGLGGVRYRWATGERAPKFPWEGPLIP